MIGITGLPCSGKGEVARILADLGVHVIDVDVVGHKVLRRQSVRRAVRDRFGADVMTPTGDVDRSALAGVVFRDLQALADLEALLHPRMAADVESEVAATRQHKGVAIDAALLDRMGLTALCDRVLLVEAPTHLRHERAELRGWPPEELDRRERRLQQEMDAIRQRAPVRIQNGGTLDQLHDRVLSMWKEQDHGHQEDNEPR